MPHRLLCQPETLASLYAGWASSIERHPELWQWPQSTLAYLRVRLGDLAADVLASETETAVQL